MKMYTAAGFQNALNVISLRMVQHVCYAERLFRFGVFWKGESVPFQKNRNGNRLELEYYVKKRKNTDKRPLYFSS